MGNSREGGKRGDRRNRKSWAKKKIRKGWWDRECKTKKGEMRRELKN